KPARQQRGQSKEERNANECLWVTCRHAKELTGQDASRPKPAQDSHQHADHHGSAGPRSRSTQKHFAAALRQPFELPFPRVAMQPTKKERRKPRSTPVRQPGLKSMSEGA